MGFADDRDLEETAQRLRAWLAGQLRMPAQSFRVEGLEAPLGTGFSSDTLLCELVRTDVPGETREGLVVRLQPEEAIIFPDSDVGLQRRVLQMLEPTEVPVPRVRWYEEDRSVLGTPFYVMDRVEGEIPSDSPPMHEEGWIAEQLSPEQREQVWWSGLQAMCEVHRLDWKTLGFDFLLEPERGPTPLTQQLDYYEDFFAWGMPRQRHPDIAAAMKYLQDNRPAEDQIALCWGDSRLANQIFSGQKCVAVLDWEMVRVGDPVQDLAWWLASDRCFSEGLDLPRLEGLPGRDETISHWEKATGFSAKDFEYYEILALTRFSMQMARVGQYMKKIEIIDEENEFDYENLASVTLRRAMEAV